MKAPREGERAKPAEYLFCSAASQCNAHFSVDSITLNGDAQTKQAIDSLDVEVPLVARLLWPQDAEPAVADEHGVVHAQDVRIPRSDPRDL